jgi:hypothetical protein
MVNYAVVWCGVVWCGVVWCGVVWCGVVWCGVVCPLQEFHAKYYHPSNGRFWFYGDDDPTKRLEVLNAYLRCVCVWGGGGNVVCGWWGWGGGWVVGWQQYVP